MKKTIILLVILILTLSTQAQVVGEVVNDFFSAKLSYVVDGSDTTYYFEYGANKAKAEENYEASVKLTSTGKESLYAYMTKAIRNKTMYEIGIDGRNYQVMHSETAKGVLFTQGMKEYPYVMLTTQELKKVFKK
ncbi:MAG: hypothetical protein EOO46_09315 [Flavobacterium sp.]|nr:MAG: hypothetical protein EOO46_09315 [Flavobacterium sp.]